MPEAAPELALEQRAAQPLELGAGEVEAQRVEHDLRVGPVGGVDRQQPRERGTRQLGDGGLGALDEQLDLARRRQRLAAPSRQPHPVRAGDPARRRPLDHPHRLQPASGAAQLGLQLVDPGARQPGRGPGVEVAATGFGQRGEEVVEAGAAPGVAPEVGAQPSQERVAEVGLELTQGGRPLAIGDPVEVQEHGVGVGDRTDHGVAGAERVLAQRPALELGPEGAPHVLDVELGVGLEREVRSEGREALVEPQVVPPTQGDQVAEPHVGQLVEQRLGAVEAVAPAGAPAVDQLLVERDQADVLHRAGVELGDEHLVVLGERERVVEGGGEEP